MTFFRNTWVLKRHYDNGQKNGIEHISLINPVMTMVDIACMFTGNDDWTLSSEGLLLVIRWT
ncbi:hypothetical protein JHK85_021452 [Glycine max]|nr:hypothetical protein JHK87_020907 [Glycine soja]KAG5015316.1 hypothetical protein JHK85_021452 [Glycine max]KAG5025103.1 hypothetical protein JHK86_021017 [Glycine max]KHN12366.1 hypothetical protein glysoja_018496 [Glycine soja]